jgi:hypothetical protein
MGTFIFVGGVLIAIATSVSQRRRAVRTAS